MRESEIDLFGQRDAGLGADIVSGSVLTILLQPSARPVKVEISDKDCSRASR
jgi:hypothetical protein